MLVTRGVIARSQVVTHQRNSYNGHWVIRESTAPCHFILGQYYDELIKILTPQRERRVLRGRVLYEREVFRIAEFKGPTADYMFDRNR